MPVLYNLSVSGNRNSSIVIILLFICVISVKGTACCKPVSVQNDYFSSDVVLAGKVKRVFSLERERYKVSIEIDEIFRGDSISIFTVYSTPKDYYEVANGDTIRYFRDLDIFLRENENWIIFANKDSTGNYSTNGCKLTRKYALFRSEDIEFLRSRPDINDIEFSANERNIPYLAIGAEDYILDYEVFIDDLSINNPVNCEVVIDTTGRVINHRSYGEDNTGIDKVIYDFLKSKEPYSVGTFNGIKVKTKYFIKVDKR